MADSTDCSPFRHGAAAAAAHQQQHHAQQHWQHSGHAPPPTRLRAQRQAGSPVRSEGDAGEVSPSPSPSLTPPSGKVHTLLLGQQSAVMLVWTGAVPNGGSI